MLKNFRNFALSSIYLMKPLNSPIYDIYLFIIKHLKNITK